MNIIGIDPNTNFIAYAVMSNDMKILDKGKHELDDLNEFLDGKIDEFDVEAIAVEDYVFYGKVLNHYHMDTIKLIGRIQEYCIIKGMKFMAFGKPEINKAISRNKSSNKASMQKFVKWYLVLKEPIKPQHVNDAVCVAIVGMNKWKQEELKQIK